MRLNRIGDWRLVGVLIGFLVRWGKVEGMDVR